MLVTGSIKQNKNAPFILGVAGGSGSGKTYFSKALQKALGSQHCEIISQDNFYIDQSRKFDFDGGSVNFDHPNSIDFSLLSKHIDKLKNCEPTQIPVYDFVTHSRKKETIPVQPAAVIIVDGILIFHEMNLRQQFDDLLFFDTPEDLRFQRRLERDIKERGREPEGVRHQFFKQVKPMHDQFVEPSKAFAKTVVKELGDFESTLEQYLKRLQQKISAHH